MRGPARGFTLVLGLLAFYVGRGLFIENKIEEVLSMHPKLKLVFVGVDTHKRTHTACILNCFCEKLGEITFDNKPAAFETLLAEVNNHLGKGMKAVYGLEDVGGAGRALAVFLLKNRFTVKKIDSSLTHSERGNQSITRKTDSLDAFFVAKVLLNGFDSLPGAEVHDVYWTLSMLVNRRNAIVKANTALKNQIHALIVHNYPCYQQFFYEFDCKTSLAFMENYPSPSKLQGVDIKEFAKFLKKTSNGNYSIQKAKGILALIEGSGDTSAEYQESRDFLISECVGEIHHNNGQIARIEDQMRDLVSLLGYRLETMIGVEMVTAASLIAEIGNIDRFASADKLAMYSGIAPVPYSSGDKDSTRRNKRGNRKLYGIFHSIAARQISRGRGTGKFANPIFADYYQKKLSQGKTEKQALVCVMRRLVNIIYGMLKYKSEYHHPMLPK